MGEELAAGCTRPASDVGDQLSEEAPQTAMDTPKPQGARMIQVGKKAPDFSAPAYVNGSFTSVRLSDHLGKWVVLCFYPGDFTFV